MKKKIAIGTALFLIVCLIAVILLYEGVVRLAPSATRYPVRGVDVSSYQGTIDWDIIAAQGISFAFIKATEGSSLVDAYFADNHANAARSGIRVGAYHFLSYDSGGATQAENFISVVPVTAGMLPPVIDIEFYGGYSVAPPDAAHVSGILDDMLYALEKHYGLKPILYVTRVTYNLYIKGVYESDYDLWIRDVYLHPGVTTPANWTFWQYSDTGRLDGYSGPEECIDLNVFAGSEEEFKQYAKKPETFETEIAIS